ncbi:MAG: outer membrane beta-barrel protein [Saprospiraceae bacterium]|nr:outer membrane beta-barrel protein [Saprospiraceae bacterium]
MLRIIVFFSLMCFAQQQWAQGFAFGAKGGLTLGVQDWNGFEQDPLFKYHGILFIESLTEETGLSIFAQAGYHVKGSAIRNQIAFGLLNNNQVFRLPPREFQFKNISLTVGAKKKYDIGGSRQAYYLFGIRGDYTVGTNLEQYELFTELYNTLIFPINGFVQEFNYGATLGGGLEFPIAELVGTVLEFTINPDFSYQYRQPQINAVYNPYTGNNSSIGERLIRNLTIEVTAGFRFLRKIEYID